MPFAAHASGKPPVMDAKPLPTYRTPPLNEVVCGVVFEPIKDLLVPHVGLFWESIADTYPRIEQVPIIGDFGEFLQRDGYVAPRIWLISRDDDHLVQIQQNRLHFNWRRRDSDYPRFSTVYANFKDCLDRFSSFIDERNLGQIVRTQYELSYINVITKDAAWNSFGDFSSVFPDIRWRTSVDESSRFLPPPTSLLWHVSVPLPHGRGEGTIKVQSAKTVQTNDDVLRAEFAAVGPAKQQDLDDLDTWFDAAHTWAVRAFEDITSESAQQELWGKL